MFLRLKGAIIQFPRTLMFRRKFFFNISAQSGRMAEQNLIKFWMEFYVATLMKTKNIEIDPSSLQFEGQNLVKY